MRGSHVASLVNFAQWIRRQRDGRTDGRTDGGVHNIPIAFFKRVDKNENKNIKKKVWVGQIKFSNKTHVKCNISALNVNGRRHKIKKK